MYRKLVFVAAAALMLAAVVSPAAIARANVVMPAAGIAPAQAEDAISPSPMVNQLQPFHMQPQLLTNADQERRLSPGAIIGLICAIAASSIALGVAFGLRRRIDRIAGPDPDKADDD